MWLCQLRCLAFRIGMLVCSNAIEHASQQHTFVQFTRLKGLALAVVIQGPVAVKVGHNNPGEVVMFRDHLTFAKF